MEQLNDYDSTKDVIKHQNQVSHLIDMFITDLANRSIVHDASKLGPEEKPYFDKYVPELRETNYGSNEYKLVIEKMKPAVDHHNQHNRHHIEYHSGGIHGMNLMDITEMLCDWIAAAKRDQNGDIFQSLIYLKHRWIISHDLYNILVNTVKVIQEKEETNV